ncbi:helix-turn-helix transcriptional regulator [Actinokineospora sp. 24-640]
MAHQLFGRAAELTALSGLLAQVTGGVPAIVVLDGDPGVGKSLLLGEFVDLARASDAEVLVGGCLDLKDGGIPYGPLTDALRTLVRQRGEQRARELAGPAWAELAGLIADFTVGGEPSAALGAQTRVFGAVSRLLDHIGGHRPLVLVFEDVHWADTATLDLITYLVQTASDQRMLLICSCRSGLSPRHPLRTRMAEPAFARRITRIGLAPFTRTETRSFVAVLTGGDVSPEQADRHFELSEGNPYFTEQLVAVADSDETTGGLPRVPKSLTELMVARINLLSGDAAKLLKVVAVAGRRVGDELLSRIVDLDDATLGDALTECLNRGVLIADNVDESYSCQHALLRRTAYESVRPRERRRLHAVLAEALAEEVSTNPQVLTELAYHWFAANRLAEALRTSVGAGDLAMRLRAFTEAEAQYRRALEVWPRVLDAELVAGATRVRVLKVAADAARWAGHLAQAVAWAREAVDTAGPEVGPALAGELHERLGSYLWEAGYDDEYVAVYRTARRLLEDTPPSAVGSRVAAALATAEVKRGRCAPALVLAAAAHDEAVASGSLAETGRAKSSSGLALSALGRHEPGISDLRAALRIAEEADHLEDMLRACSNLGVCLERAGQVGAAVQVFQDGLAKVREMGLLGSRLAGLLANNACATLFLVGEWAEAAVLIEEVMRYYPARETTFQRLTKAEMDLATGRDDEARRMLESVRTLPSAQPRFLSPLYRCLAELAVRRGDGSAALATVRHGLEAVAGTEDRLLVLPLCAYGLRVAADELDGDGGEGARQVADELAERARAVPNAADGNSAGNDSAVDGVQGEASSDDDVEVGVLVAQCAVEHDRGRGVDTAAAWTAVAESWRRLGRPYPRAYALARAAAAAARAGNKRPAAAAAEEAEAIAAALGAGPLAALIARIVAAHRLKRVAKPRAKRPFGVSDRELEVLRLVADGFTTRQIAGKLHLAVPTVANHRINIKKKLEAATTAAAVDTARAAGLLDEQ